MKILAATAVLSTVLAPACQPEELPQTCEAAIGLAWLDKPVPIRVQMQRIAFRESRNIPTAVNRHSGATGCTQLMPMHSRLAARLGYTWADMKRAWPNARVARLLFDAAGFRPWALTA